MPSLLNPIKAFLKRTPLYPPVRSYFQRKRYQEWLARGKQGQPPHLAKQLVVKDYAQRFSTPIMVETGTYLGDMVDATLPTFKRIYTIELGDLLFNRAQAKYRNTPQVTVLHGDSGAKLPEILAQVQQPALFWLDAHYTAGLGVSARAHLDSPILAELRHIAAHPQAQQHVILIDDAHEFVGTGGYPTLDALKAEVNTLGYKTMDVQDNIVRIHN